MRSGDLLSKMLVLLVMRIGWGGWFRCRLGVLSSFMRGQGGDQFLGIG